jgi:hypothetical protein
MAMQASNLLCRANADAREESAATSRRKAAKLQGNRETGR